MKRFAYAAAIGASSASAAILSFSSNVQQINPVGNIGDDAPGSNTMVQVFDELQGVTLLSDLTVDGDVIAAGTVIDSHMVFLNRASGTSQIRLMGNVTFTGTILGTMSDVDGALLDASDFLGAPRTYDSFDNRGLEGNDSISFAGATLDFDFIVTQPGDWVRVVTVATVPLPAPILLFGSGLLAFGALRRRKAKS